MSVRSRSLAVAAALLTGVAAFAWQARASSDAAWGEFRANVETACRAAGEGVLDAAGVTVDPFGSERFGIAVLQGTETGGGARRSVVCLYDKAARTAEIGGLLDLGAAEAPPPVPPIVSEPGDLAAPFGGRCAEECEASLSTLSDGDREGVIDLPARIRRTLAGLGEMSTDGGTKAALGVARILADDPGAEGAPLAAPTAAQPGETECTLRWFGFLGEGAKTVGSHRCRIAKAADGTVSVEKLTGERLLVHLVPLTDHLSLAVGRSFLDGQPERDYDLRQPLNAGNANFGNVVGLATLSGGQIHLIGGAELGMNPADNDFFSVLTLAGS